MRKSWVREAREIGVLPGPSRRSRTFARKIGRFSTVRAACAHSADSPAATCQNTCQNSDFCARTNFGAFGSNFIHTSTLQAGTEFPARSARAVALCLQVVGCYWIRCQCKSRGQVFCCSERSEHPCARKDGCAMPSSGWLSLDRMPVQGQRTGLLLLGVPS
jgi:hypothetical protein